MMWRGGIMTESLSPYTAVVAAHKKSERYAHLFIAVSSETMSRFHRKCDYETKRTVYSDFLGDCSAYL